MLKVMRLNNDSELNNDILIVDINAFIKHIVNIIMYHHYRYIIVNMLSVKVSIGVWKTFPFNICFRVQGAGLVCLVTSDWRCPYHADKFVGR